MHFLQSRSAPLLALALAVFVFGAGLTSPIWLIVGGARPLDAIHEGTPIVGITIAGLIVTVVLALVVNHLRHPEPSVAVAVDSVPAPSKRSEMVVQIVVMLMFIIPFVTILLGYLLRSVIDADAG